MEANKTTYTVEYLTEIWDDKTGERIEFGPDRDSLGLVEIRSKLSDGTVEVSFTMQPEQAYLLGLELVKAYGKERCSTCAAPIDEDGPQCENDHS